MISVRQLQQLELEAARAAGEEFFLDFPDSWYEDPHYACENGHVAIRYLKSEQLGRPACLECQGVLFLIPSKYTSDELLAAARAEHD